MPLLVAGCRTNDSGEAAFGDFVQGLTLAIEGVDRIVPLESMDVWLTDGAASAEPFEIRGGGVALVGKLPREAHIDYDENWSTLVGREIPLSNRGGDPAYEKPATVSVPGVGQFRVIGGSFTIEQVRAGSQGRTPLTGRIELVVRAAGGRATLSGTIAVLAMTWG